MGASPSIFLHGLTVWDTGERIDLALGPHRTAPIGSAPCLDESGTLGKAWMHALDAGEDIHVDCSGLTLAPGLCDPHVHFRDPGQTQKESMLSGCAAAASGGYTNVLIMPNTLPALDGAAVKPGDQGAQEVTDAGFETSIDYLQHYAEVIGETLPVRYCLCVAASTGREGLQASDIGAWKRFLRGQGASGTSGVAEGPDSHPVIAISDDGAAIADGILSEVAEHALLAGIPIVDHCEHHESGVINEGEISRRLNVPGIPSSTELTIVDRDIELARRTGQHVHLQHVSTAAAFEAIRRAKREGLPVTCETAPHYLALCDEDVLEHGTLAKMNPPLRSAADRQATIEAVCDGTVDMIATDHAPHTIAEKQLPLSEAPNGIIGLESAYGVCHSVLVDGGFIDDRRLIELMAVAPAGLMGVPSVDITAMLSDPSLGKQLRLLDLRGRDDADAIDMSILAPDEQWTIDPGNFHSKARNTPFGSWKVTGRPIATVISSSLAFSRIPQGMLIDDGQGA
ncbi:MAG: dihydroorotase [Bifidobacterium psychraerophilum]|uniref:dihydroorotase n=1 Tax=Bifidobacterium psychraerophilum TaxID=218140 RepID=UPI0039EBCFCA